MKIVAKVKDYYDYLKGIYGEDPLLVLDRSQAAFRMFTPVDGEVDTLYIGEYAVQGMWRKGVFLMGEELKPYQKIPLDKSRHRRYSYGTRKFQTGDQIEVLGREFSNRTEYSWVLTKPLFLGDAAPTWRLDCPILLEEERWGGTVFTRFPILHSFNMYKTFPPEEIWLILSEWLGRRNTLKEKTVPIGDDKIRIQAHGFDVKTSFRNM